MATTPHLSAPPAQLSRTSCGVLLALITAALVAAHFPLLAQHAVQIWLRPHYRFFPFVLVGAAVLAWLRLADLRGLQPAKPWLAALALASTWLVLVAAELLASSWLGCVAALLMLGALAYAVGGWEVCRRLWPAWLLLWLIVPPPLELDREVILWLQGWTTRWSSAILDVLGVYHVMAGNVVEIDGQRMMVEDACSGINSLFSVLACSLFLIFLIRRPPVWGTLLVCAALVWVLLANVARVVGIALLKTWWSLDVSSGMRHEAFGVLLFLVAVALLVSTDQLLSFLFAPATGSEVPVAPEVSEAGGSGLAVPRENLVWLGALAVPAYLLLLGGHFVLKSQTTTHVPAAATLNRALLEQLDANTMPEKLGPWQRVRFHTDERDMGSFFGDYSRTWTYRQGDRTATLSLDYPFPNWHDLTRCYTGQGWRMDEQLERSTEAMPGGFVGVKLTKPAYRTGYLMFCQFNDQGEPLQARRGAAQLSLFRHQSGLRSLYRRLSGKEAGPVDPPGTVFQWQMMVESHAPLTEGEQNSLHELFVQTYQILQRKWQ